MLYGGSASLFFKLTGLKFTHHLIDDFRDPAYYTWRQSTQFKF